MANVLNYDIVESEFEFQSPYYIPIVISALEKGINLLIPTAMD